MDKVTTCADCKYSKGYHYGKDIYYCDHEERTDDMGKLGKNKLPEEAPEWCPLRDRGVNAFE